MMPTGYSIPNSRSESLNSSGTSSGTIIPNLPPAKMRHNEIALAVPVVAMEMASEGAIAV